MRGQTKKFLNKFFCPESREIRNVSNGVEQTNYNFSKIVGRVSQENRNISKRGQTNNFFEQIFRS